MRKICIYREKSHKCIRSVTCYIRYFHSGLHRSGPLIPNSNWKSTANLHVVFFFLPFPPPQIKMFTPEKIDIMKRSKAL